MQTDYRCIFDINYQNGDVTIIFHGDQKEIRFTFMLAFFSIPTFFNQLLCLWKGKITKAELDGFGFVTEYHFTVVEMKLFIKHLTDYEAGKYQTYHYEFDFEKFLKALEKGFSSYIDEQYENGRLPLRTEEFSHPLSPQVLKEFEDFSSTIKE